MNYKKLEKEIKKVLEENGYKKLGRKPTFIKYFTTHKSLQLEYHIQRYDYNSWKLLDIPKISVSVAFVEIARNVQEARSLYFLSKKMFKDKEKVEKKLNELVENLCNAENNK